MKFYIVGFGERTTRETRYPRAPVLGDALVHASNARDALTSVRQAGLIPNPGDIYVLGGREAGVYKSDFEVEPWMMSEARDSPGGVYILWRSDE